ncbi:M15 family metallopeptidase [Haliangium sp.]|uniref:M15 family metallopeptidase n=1 Tax=Haliangium sp. TaxID=2663208 RepID=UPI003D095A2F
MRSLSARVALAAMAWLLVAISPSAHAQPAPAKSAPNATERGPDVAATLAAHPGLVDAADVVSELQVDLRYATADNFLGRPIYGELDRCYLQRDAAEMLAKAQAELERTRPEWRLRAWDCARPRWVQRQMWKLVAGTPQQGYVANPKRGSIHNYGCAIDLTLATRDGVPVDMGTPFDFFGPRARPDREFAMLQDGTLSPAQVANRLVLRELMLRAGFRMLANEWWHFDCATQRDTRRRYRPVP